MNLLDVERSRNDKKGLIEACPEKLALSVAEGSREIAEGRRNANLLKNHR